MPSKTHGMSYGAEYRAWKNMIQRCTNARCPYYKNYGGRGIRVCREWSNSFEAFFESVGRRPSPKHTLDRIDNSGHYEPGNCRWATRATQLRNRRNNVLVGDMVLADASKRYGIPKSTLKYRVRSGWPTEEALGLKERQSRSNGR